ncbi:GNAT family N-acetyltransferase [Aliiglaciecola sp. CAU 1673]|uniref:GNAT family N-acetyltransferase n=1 Tax=Aliiglaciecola sp. CAU 1673 TaxID=3032595 RepID=UPI0023DC3296|nr:GNAT family N-acetyltransferase [Aliiglaciecola sp. CAU 1673]MDF2178086.1 GNAT family N-acetyltransferase [Aliiglaciecola sp. CAU 1673]
MKFDIAWCKFADLDTQTLYALLRLRQQVFILEQQSIYEDLDDLDQQSWHLLIKDDNRLAGYARLRADITAYAYKFERLVLDPQYRSQGLGKVLMQQLLAKSAELGQFSKLKLSAQSHLVPFYQRFGFAAIGQEYDDGGIPHRDMIGEHSV